MITSRRVEIALLVLVLAIAAVLRFLWLDIIPVGWHHDEALMGVMASGVYRGVDRPIFFPQYLGQEPLYIYLSAGMMWLLGGNQDILPLRMTSALVGVATVGVAYLLGRDLFGRRVGMIGAALVALSFSQLMMSRDGYRVITQPLLEALTVLLLWRAGRRDSRWYYLAAGIALGATLYTYLGARLFPGVFPVFAVWYVLARGRPSTRMSQGAAIFGVASAVVVAPLMVYFMTHPGTFSARMDQVTIVQAGASEATTLSTLASNIQKLLSIFTVDGDPLWRYNLSGRPVFVGALVPLFYIGTIVAIWQTVKGRAASALVMAWIVTMFFPSILSREVGSYTLRSMGLVPATFLLPAMGLVAVWDWMVARVPRLWHNRTKNVFVALTVAVLLVEGFTTYRDYFTVWASSYGSAYEDMADMVAAARFLGQQARPGNENIFVSSQYYPNPIVSHLAPQAAAGARWFDGNSAVVFSPNSQKDSLYVFPLTALPPEIDSYLPPDTRIGQAFFDNGEVKMSAYRLAPAQVQAAVDRITLDPSVAKIDQKLGDELELIGYRVDSRVKQGGKLAVIALWRILKSNPSSDYVVFAHLLEGKDTKLAQRDSELLPPQEWRAGDVVVGRYIMDIGEKVQPGRYLVEMGVYDRKTMDRLPLEGSVGPQDHLALGFTKVDAGGKTVVAPTTPMDGRLGDAINFLGFDLLRPPGQQHMQVNLYWQAIATPKQDYTVFVQLLDPGGHLVAQSDSQPASGRLPTSYWDPGEKIVDEHGLDPAGPIPAGTYTLIAGMYDLSTGKRLPVAGGGDYLTLASFDISP